MRWVLGEQSAKQLRGSRMDEVIFAGNNHRRPLGMAEVTLTFDNADSVLPTPFAEIAVTRRVYRTGESEYFLNRAQVRLRDIMDLLLGTGLGPDASAIISQGQIDAILSAKPGERREIFEEAAGTSKYQARKREAQRRLEQTETNALRVNDVLVEIEQQVPALETQVRRAKRYRKATQTLRDLEILSFVRKTAARREERKLLGDVLSADESVRAGTGARMQNKQGLMDELTKMIRVLGKLDPTAPHEVLLVLDATVGRNALAQENIFGNAIGVTGIVMTKLDGTARGGVLVPVAQASDSPIKLIGVGEGIEDLQDFDARAFSRSLVGLEDRVHG